jgi:hypothetical protein
MNARAMVAAGSVAVIMAMTTEARAQEVKGPVPAPSTVTTPIAAKVEDDSPDHERFVGHFGVGYMGISQIPIGNGAPGGTGGLTEGNVTAPIIGVRWWLQRNLGIDAGIGLGYTGGSSSVTTGGTSASTTNPSQFGFALHGGVPIVFAEGHHYTFELVPEGTVAFAGGTIKGTGGAPDIGENGFRLDLGARIGTEIHFGFIGVPELALQASVGLYFQYLNWGLSQQNNSASQNAFSLATSVQADPWAIFTNNISALYYF